MKLYSSFLLILGFLVFTSCNERSDNTESSSITIENEPTIIFLTRHAEKDTMGNDPDLSEKGIKRVNGLTSVLKHIEFDAIYSTNYKRTIKTVKPIADINSLVIMPYDADKTAETFSEKLKRDEKGNTILVSGHSNTIPFLINKLIGEEKFKQFDDHQYGDLYMVILTDGNAKLLRLYVPLINYIPEDSIKVD